MIDSKLFRENPQRLREACRLKGMEVDIEKGVELEQRRRGLIQEEEALQSERNRMSQEIGQRKRAGEDTAAAQEAMRGVNERIRALAAERAKIEEDLTALAMLIPNHPAPEVPVGASSADNVEVARWGERRIFDFQPLPHWEICERLGLVDFARGAKVAGSGFLFYRGWGARLERALFNFMLDVHTAEHGYRECFPPMLVNRAAMTGTGQLPKFETEMYGTDKGDDLFLIPTAEVPVTNLHRDEILAVDDLPLSYAAYSACFRREAGAAGKETRGMIRVHEFNKVELVKFVHPDTSGQEHEKLRANAEEILRRLGLHYRVILLCTGDLSFAAAKCYDLEVWAPGVGKYLEVSSCSNFADFQARRANIRFRDRDKKVKYVHTLNASGVALPRVFIALVETYQQADGALVIPEPLRPYMGVEIIKPAV